jgi:hypothetical protein
LLDALDLVIAHETDRDDLRRLAHEHNVPLCTIAQESCG